MGAMTKTALEATTAISTVAATRGVNPQDKLIVLGQVQRHLEGEMRRLIEQRDGAVAGHSAVNQSTGD